MKNAFKLVFSFFFVFFFSIFFFILRVSFYISSVLREKPRKSTTDNSNSRADLHTPDGGKGSVVCLNVEKIIISRQRVAISVLMMIIMKEDYN